MAIDIGIGAVLGFLSGLGVGGGSLLMLWLTAVAGLPLETARTINLLFFLPAAGISCFLRRKALKWSRILPAALAGCIAALVFSRLTLSTEFLRSLFAFLMVGMGIRELRAKK